ncbi:hypothetical protein OKW43_005749 [Paraburkholderia sp. WC7.3g]|uniref:hypothetical protein n=1 Tax=Paraburkholderia sp. WC7.3g TaxID=2991070 RepID=UPI003D1EBD50
MNRNLQCRRLTLALAMAGVVLGLSCASKAFAQSANSEVYGPGAKIAGATYAQWSQTWWQWLLAIPANKNPQNDTSGQFCATNQSGPVWYLVGSGSGQPVMRTCTVSSTSSIFFPLINVECSTRDDPPFHCTDEASCRACAKSFADEIGTNSLNASIDGAVVNGLQTFRFQSPSFFPFTLPPNNILKAPGGGTGYSISDGYWLMLKPLPPGTHTVQFGGALTSGPFAGFSVNVMYTLTVTP